MLIPKVPLKPSFSKTIAEQKLPIVYPVMKETSKIETLECIDNYLKHCSMVRGVLYKFKDIIVVSINVVLYVMTILRGKLTGTFGRYVCSMRLLP